LLDLVRAPRKTARSTCSTFISTAASNRLNEIVRVLTIISVIFMPLMLIAGIYGMNVEHDGPWGMPELRRQYEYPFALGLMALSAGGFSSISSGARAGLATLCSVVVRTPRRPQPRHRDTTQAGRFPSCFRDGNRAPIEAVDHRETTQVAVPKRRNSGGVSPCESSASDTCGLAELASGRFLFRRRSLSAGQNLMHSSTSSTQRDTGRNSTLRNSSMSDRASDIFGLVGLRRRRDAEASPARRRS
jgi:hypothetical protein